MTRYNTRGIRPQAARKYFQARNTLGTEEPAAHETAPAEISTGRKVQERVRNVCGRYVETSVHQTQEVVSITMSVKLTQKR